MKIVVAIILGLFAIKTYIHMLQCMKFIHKKRFRIERNISFIIVATCLLVISIMFK